MSKEDTTNSNTTQPLQVLYRMMCIGLICVVLFAFHSLQWKSFSDFFSVSFAALLLSGASMLVGGALGFLFGIPRTLQNDEPADENSRKISVNYRANTNLEQISDWLTKILVGVGLTQLTTIPEHLHNIGETIAPALGTAQSAPVMAVSILIFFSATGFLFGYLWTRLYLATAFRQADISQLMDRVEETDKKMDALQRQSELDAKALYLLSLQLASNPDAEPVTQEVLNDAFSAASDSVRAQIYTQAWRTRHENWQNNKSVMERTIPLFRALLHSKAGKQFHQSYAQLGYALKDQTTPDWKEAESNLTRAIDIRNEESDAGWGYYDFNRALCRIKTDPGFSGNIITEENQLKLIIGDLRASWFRGCREIIQSDTTIQNWMQLNNVSQTDLSAIPMQ